MEEGEEPGEAVVEVSDGGEEGWCWCWWEWECGCGHW
jgi:hypothetical protein